MNSLTVPSALLLGNVDVDQAPILPGNVDESVAVFGMDCLPIGVLKKGQNHRLEQVLGGGRGEPRLLMWVYKNN